MSFCDPDPDCAKCERLFQFRLLNRQKFPTYHNAPVQSFGNLDANLLVVGMAPGLHGANQTGRPFTNDGAGDVLYPALKKFGFAKGNYAQKKDDGFELINTRITNTVRCVPPQNKITRTEIKNCRLFLKTEIKAMPNLKVILAIGKDAHDGILETLGYKKSDFKFEHGRLYCLEKENLYLISSYHTSRYNINTGRLTQTMFDNVIKQVKEFL